MAIRVRIAIEEAKLIIVAGNYFGSINYCYWRELQQKNFVVP